MKPLCCVLLLVLGSARAYNACRRAASDLQWSREPDNCGVAYLCLLGRAVTYTCAQGHVIGADRRYCVPAGSELDDCTGLRSRKMLFDVPVTSSCKAGDVTPDEHSCAKYFECVKQPGGNTTMQGQECRYPDLFNVATGKCENFKDVTCQPDQVVPKSPCEYDANQCNTAHCIPCSIMYPSCSGLADGLNSWAGKEWSPFYVQCEEERVIYRGQCKSDKETQIFHPVKRECIVMDDKMMFG